ncbi:MAG: Ig-like domain-containing protein, partial [Candidatus Lambdaproteobacteria bacterium]|nr:Ig-like domain-containing protein [Candidatus Lambdaproteobacteria bacterium]
TASTRVAGATSPYTHTGLTNGQPYCYRVRGVNGVGEGPLSNEVCGTPADVTPPGPVTGFTATAGDGQLTLAWSNPSDADFASTRIVRRTDAFPTSATDGAAVVYEGSGTSHTDTGLTNLTLYYYAAFARDEVPTNYSSPATASATPQDVTPPTIGGTSPAEGATGVATASAIAVTFSEPMDTTVAAATIGGIAPAVAGTWSWFNSTTLTFTPTATFAEKTTYTVTIATAAMDSGGNALATPYSFGFTTGDFTRPTVLTTTPATSATGVTLSQTVTVIFSEAMDTSVAAATVGSIAPAVSGTWSWSGATTLTFTAATTFAEKTAYTVTVATTARDSALNPIAAAYSFGFTTGDFTRPTVSTTTPANGATSQAVSQAVSVTFSEAMDTGVAAGSVGGTAPSVAGTWSWSSSTTLTFTPSASFAEKTAYTVTVATTARDAALNTLSAAYTFGFTTGDFTRPTVLGTSPGNGAINQQVSQSIAVNFSEAMDTTEAASGVGGISPFVSGTWSWFNATTLTFTPTTTFAEKTSYTVTVATTARDAALNTLATIYSFGFATGDFTAPTVSGTSPTDGATGQPLSQTVAVVFTEAMDTSVAAGSLGSISPFVLGTWTWSNATTLTFAPATSFAEKTSYTVTIGTTARDPAGNSLAAAYGFGFTTADVTRPTVSGTSPSGGAINQPASQAIVVTFSEAMDTSVAAASVGGISPAAAGTWSWSGGTTLTFTPSATFADQTTYTVTVGTAARDPAGNTLAAPHAFTFTTGDFTRPTVAATSPANGATGQLISQTASVTFSEAMNQTATQGAFGISPSVVGSFAWSGSTLTFTPSALLTGSTTYTVTIATGARDLAGNALLTAYSFSFTTATVGAGGAPAVVSTSPGNGATGVALAASVIITFSTAMNQAQTQGAVSISPSLALAFAWSADSTTLTISHGIAFAENTPYTVTVGAGAADATGVPVAGAFSFSFTSADLTPPTVAGTSPANGATSQPVSQSLAVTFSEAMDTSVTAATVGSISPAVSGTWNWFSGTTLTFTPTATFAEKTTYSVTIGTAARDLVGNALAAAYGFGFTTGDFTAPTVSGTNPASGATGVATTANVVVTFSEAMDQAATQAAISTTLPAPTYAWSGGGAVLTIGHGTLAADGAGYSVTIGTGARDLAGNAPASAYALSFSVADTIMPTVAGTSPTDGATNQAVSQAIAVTFSEAMDTAVAAGTVGSISPAVSGTWSWFNSTTLTFTPTATFAEKTAYTVTIGTAAKDSAGNALAAPYGFGFTTGDFTRPTVSTTTPAASTTGVTLSQVVTVTFSETMDTSVAAGSVGSISPAVAGTWSWSSATTLTFAPTSTFAEQTTYAVTIATTARDSALNTLAAPYSFGFTTGDFTAPTVSGTTPANGATGVATTADVVITFSEAMDQAATQAAISTTLPAPTYAWSGGGAVLTIGHGTLPADGATYTVTIGTGARDLAGNTLASPYALSFSVADTTAPTVSGTSPANGAANQPLSLTVTVTFSEAMDTTVAADSVGSLSPAVAGTWSWSSATTLAFAPTSAFAEQTTYTVTIATTARDAALNTLAAAYGFGFTTGDFTAPTVGGTSPSNGATDVPLASAVAVTFSEAMDTSVAASGVGSIAPSVAGTWSWSTATTLTFTPSSGVLAESTAYTVTVATTAKDAAGNTLATAYLFSFTTVGVPPANVTAFTATGEDGQVLLAWTNPADADFTGVTLRRSETGYPATIADGADVSTTGANVTPGQAASLVDAGLTNGTTYYYTAFAHDAVPNYASGAQAVVRPAAPPTLAGGLNHTCAVLSNGPVKCWGSNGYGQLGLGDAENRGDNAGEMGANLPAVDLGTGRTAIAVYAGTEHTCALLNNGQVKCWGKNGAGELGLGDTSARGDVPGEMGDSLPAVDLGTGRTARAIGKGWVHTCALLDDGSVKCWGTNEYGQLGLGDVARRGNQPGQMGDTLPSVDLGTGRTAVAIAAGGEHSCALLDNGSLKCWGNNGNGQLGLRDAAHRGNESGEMGDALPAVNLGTGRTAVAVAVGEDNTCALLDNGTVKCWGNNTVGQLGQGNTTRRGDSTAAGHEMGDALPPIDLGSGRTAVAISSGGFSNCALLDDGSLKCWGSNIYGQLGLGHADNRGDIGGEMGDALPAVDLGTGRTAMVIDAGYWNTCARLDNGTLKCWGLNAAGSLGLGDTTRRGDEPNEMGDNLPAVDLVFGNRIAAGLDHTCALRDDGMVKCWGSNYAGLLGQGDTANRGDGPGEMGNSLLAVDLGTGRTTTDIAAGGFNNCALLDTGQVKCWGDNYAGALGLGGIADRGDDPGEMGDNLPTVSLGTGRTAIALVAGNYYTCALLDTGQVKCWGYNMYGQLGIGNTEHRGDEPGEMGDNLSVVDLGTGRTAVAIAAGEGHSCALLDTGQVKCWGYNGSGQLGLGDTDSRGDNSGEMGDSLPAVPLGSGRTATALAAGSHHTCVLLDTGQVKCWGNNDNGQLGLGDIQYRGDQAGEMGDALPAVDLGTGSPAIALAAGKWYTCALRNNGQVKCWGNNTEGQLGQGNTTRRGDSTAAGHEMGDSLPAVDLGTGRTATAIAAGGQFACARLDNGTLKCWGYGGSGQLGLGDTATRGDAPGEMGDALPTIDLGTP